MLQVPGKNAMHHSHVVSFDSRTVKTATANITRVRFALEPHMLFSEMPVGIGPCGIFAPAYLAENRAITLY